MGQEARVKTELHLLGAELVQAGATPPECLRQTQVG